VVTRTTELATEVYFKEAIQKAKWRLKKSPERRSHPILSFSHPFHVFLQQAKGVNMREASIIL
jgi:hypothetical protein